ncbi:MAG: hypothetical protein JOZ53_14735 [Planctomycetaceae bacterium]|nr:hypothetical protein [Planctomycetaceae bacterium]
MRLDSHNFSPAILGKIVRAAARGSSFEDAAESLADQAEITISGRQVGRIAHEVGAQLRDDRDRRVADFQHQQAQPEAPVVPRLAVVLVDGGRLQTRSEEPSQGPGVHDPAWREDKVANLLTMSTQSHDQDPHPELPRCFTTPRAVVELVQGVVGQGALADVAEAAADAPPALTVFEPAEDAPEPRWPPEPLVRTCQATLASSEEFGPMAAAEAQRRNFFAAQARAFLGDGGAWIWTLHRTFFPTFEPIVDFVPVLTHVDLAAKAVGGPAAAVWERYRDWATACWQGRVATVLEQLRAVLEEIPPPSEGEGTPPTDPAEVIRLTIGYLAHNQPRMAYPRYRRAGLPTCSGLVESLIKQFNRRVKGSEKFWNPTQAETILQLRAAYRCEDDRLARHLKNRTVSPFRRYETTKRRKAG